MVRSSPTAATAPVPAEAQTPALSWRLVRREGRPADVVAFEESVVAFFLDAAALLGAPKSLAAIYGILFASPKALSFSEVRERLDISAGSISQGLRVLREIGALKVIADEIDRRECFTPDMELRNLVNHYLEKRVQTQLDSGRDRLQAIGKALPNDGNGSAKLLKSRLKALQTWHDKARAVLPMAKTFLKLAG